MNKLVYWLWVSGYVLFLLSCTKQKEVRTTTDFNSSWFFHLGDVENGHTVELDHSTWRPLNLPHDWSIEGEFSPDHPATTGGGALPGGVGWYRKTFTLPEEQQGKAAFVEFDGVYMNSEVWINGAYLGKRPNGYISFAYDLTPYLNYGEQENVIAVKVDNSQQPNSRWYSGSGIYRNVRLTLTDKVHVEQWGTFVSTPEINEQSALVNLEVTVKNSRDADKKVIVNTVVYDPENKKVAEASDDLSVAAGENGIITHEFTVENPALWDINHPHLYKALTQVEYDGKVKDDYETTFGIRSFAFDPEEGFILNGRRVKIKGVCNHHDLGCLGAAVNKRAIERQLEILKEMGVNAIRTAHNPPAPELLELCDKMGFVVMDEIFDMWKKGKSPYDYHLYWDEWHERDLRDFIRRDRNHPSVIVWSIGNEILEQWDSTGIAITRELVDIVHELDTTRPTTAGCNPPGPHNNLIRAGVLDLIGYNYDHKNYEEFPEVFPGQKFIATETSSALATRGYYDMPSDTIKRWPIRWDLPFTEGNPDNTVSAYDHVSTPWGSTHEETWKIIKKHDYMSGMFIWTGFDYLGEPTPYGWPSKSSYFGVVDLAGFPKDSYYMYQSEWTDKETLHIFPHWNWQEGDTVDIWAYFNTDEAELFLNGKSLGAKTKAGDQLHTMWRVPYQPGAIKAIGRTNGDEVAVKEIKTAGKPAKIRITADRSSIHADGKDLSFITVEVLDSQGTLVPYSDNLVNFEVVGEAAIAGVDNGDPTSREPFKAEYRKAFHGKCLAVVQAKQKPGKVQVRATSDGLQAGAIELTLE